MELGGIYPALTTPFTSDGEVDVKALRENVSLYNKTAVSGYVVLGSTGESVMLSSSEGETILAAACEAAARDKQLIAGTGAESTAETIRKTKQAAGFGYKVALIKTPHYYKPAYKPETLIEHYRKVADASPIPIVLYSIPQFTGVTLETREILALAEHPNIVGIKDSSGDVRRLGEVIASARSSFHVLTGSAAIVFPALMIGAHGAILALAAALPEMCSTLYELFRKKKYEEARELQSKLVMASKRIVSEAGIPGVKYAMDRRGYQGGAARLPLQPVNDETKRKINEVIATLEPSIAHTA
jgi:4-hydroxy-2-oxoglutarate aldolase